MSKYTEKLDAIAKYCLFQSDEEIAQVGDTVVQSFGVRIGLGFHPGRLQEKKPEIKALVLELVNDVFLRPSGGCGASFLYLSYTDTKTRERWGTDRDADILFILAQACGWAGFCLPKHMWFVFSDGLPYVWFCNLNVTEVAQVESPEEQALGFIALLDTAHRDNMKKLRLEAMIDTRMKNVDPKDLN